jgi:RNA polymerase sigma-70 factor (ECF subfamily)
VTTSEFAALYDAHVRVVRSILFRVAPHGLLDDLTQEVFLRAWRGREQFRGEASSRTWLLRIASNVAIDAGRRQGARAARFVDGAEAHEGALEQPAGRGTEAADPTERDAVGRVLSLLGPEERLLLVLLVIEEFSTEEASAVLDVPPGTVKSRAFAARQKFRRLYVAETGVSETATASTPDPAVRQRGEA